jgi:hypothetical protein
MKTSKAKRKMETIRKQKRKARMKPFLRLLKQTLYYQETGIWEEDAKLLHWHHIDPSLKTRKICHLTTRHPRRVAEELAKCVVMHEVEHLELHRVRVLRTK